MFCIPRTRSVIFVKYRWLFIYALISSPETFKLQDFTNKKVLNDFGKLFSPDADGKKGPFEAVWFFVE